MENYTASDIIEFKRKHEHAITHVIVAHTKFRPYVSPQSKSINNIQARINWQANQAKLDLRHALNCFNKALYPGATNKPIRRPDLYKPLTLVTIEGAKETTDSRQTIHFNISLGNLPAGITTSQIKALFTEAWVGKVGQSKDIWVGEYYRQPEVDWQGYTVKEANKMPERAWSTDGIWDVENCWVPTTALAAD